MSEAQQLIADRDSEISAIQSNPELTEQAKANRIAAVREVYEEEWARAKADEQAKLQSDLETSKLAVFRVPMEPHATQAERAQVASAFRRVWNDVEFETSGAEADVVGSLSNMLDYSLTFGDELMEEAVYRRAVQIEEARDPNVHEAFRTDVSPILERYHARHPQAAKKYERYMKAREAIAATKSFEHLLAGGMSDNLFR